MNRSFGFEKTIQAGQYSPVKVSTYINDVPADIWTQEGFVEELYNLLTVQTYKVLQNEFILSEEIKSPGGDKKQILNNVEKQILETLDLKNLIINLNVEIK